MNNCNKVKHRPLLKIENLMKHYPIFGGLFHRQVNSVKAVNDVGLELFEGETLGLVGESGCGKSTLGRLIMALEKPDSGKIIYRDDNIINNDKHQLKEFRKKVQIIFQDPFSSLNPRKNVAHIVGEPLYVHSKKSRKERNDRVMELLEKVGLKREHMKRYPHQFSGGQRQRIGIARALALRPELVVCDEAVSALDVSIRAQVINLLKDLQTEFGLTYIFISHDLSIVKHVSDRVAVMYLGRIVELMDSESLYENPLHPYTKALLSAVPRPDPKYKSKRIILSGDVPSPIAVPPGCSFNTRCSFSKRICSEKRPYMKKVSLRHFVACHLVE
ncbi:MAG: dipeptide ABC transporter ATP-binding protein [Deltaproteobacteria bacterium]|nr:dipeptide ABC transporter ATP-binding protein [Deltaproteobacteria bacterium]